MSKKFQYVSLGIGAVFLIVIGLILDRVGGFGVRTDDVSSSVSLSFSEPAMLGVPLTVRWIGEEEQNIGVTMRLISGGETLLLGNSQLRIGSMPVTIPCALPPAPFRLELINTTSGAILGVSSLNTLPPGPDCVK